MLSWHWHFLPRWEWALVRVCTYLFMALELWLKRLRHLFRFRRMVRPRNCFRLMLLNYRLRVFHVLMREQSSGRHLRTRWLPLPWMRVSVRLERWHLPVEWLRP